MNILVVNNGSSSLKLHIVAEGDRVLASRSLPAVTSSEMASALGEFLGVTPACDAAGHRVVHGGTRFTGPLLLDESAEDALATLADLAPLHNPPALAAIEALASLRPTMPQVACFDTAFHAHMPARAATYALPADWRHRFGLRRFGFHGLSHAWAVHRAAALLGRPADTLRLVTAHLGAGASLAAIERGRSVDTTMGYTPLEGVVMATRSGTVDPGLVLWLLRDGGLSADEVQEGLERHSGLLGLSAVSADLREVLAAADKGNGDAVLAYAVFAYRIRTAVGTMAAAMGGIDGLVFTGGAGAGSPRLRTDVVAGLGFLGLEIDENAQQGGSDAVLSPPGTSASVLVVESREDLEIARQVRAILA